MSDETLPVQPAGSATTEPSTGDQAAAPQDAQLSVSASAAAEPAAGVATVAGAGLTLHEDAAKTDIERVAHDWFHTMLKVLTTTAKHLELDLKAEIDKLDGQSQTQTPKE